MTMALNAYIDSVRRRRRRRRAAGLVSPLALGSALEAWWDASYGVTVTGSGVSEWLDRQHSYALVQTTDAARPPYSLTGFDGEPCLTLDGVADYMTMESQPFPSGSSPVEIFAVFQQSAVDTGTRTVFGYGGTAGAAGRSLQRVSGDAMRANVGTGGGTSFAEDAVNLVTSRHLVHGIWTATGVSLSVDDNDYVTPTAAVPATDTVRVRLGSSLANTAAGFWSGSVRDIVVTGPLVAEQRAFVTEFLLNRR